MRFLTILVALISTLYCKAYAQSDVSTLAFVGDVMLAETEATGKFLAAGGDPFTHVRRMLSIANLRVANFESSAGTRGRADLKKPFSFRASQQALLSFSSVFEVAGLANNHVGDYGREDLVETIDSLNRAGSITFGGGRNAAQAHRAAIFDLKGVKVALLGYLDFFPRWFTATSNMPGVAWLDEDQVALDIRQARIDHADVVIIVPHWGVEHELMANSHQRRLARAMIDAGADAIIGGHPHVVQDFEIYKDKPIIYSLGNFVFDGFEDDDSNTGWVLFVKLDKSGVIEIKTKPIQIDSNGSPWPQSQKRGPCWYKSQINMTLCSILDSE